MNVIWSTIVATVTHGSPLKKTFHSEGNWPSYFLSDTRSIKTKLPSLLDRFSNTGAQLIESNFIRCSEEAAEDQNFGISEQWNHMISKRSVRRWKQNLSWWDSHQQQHIGSKFGLLRAKLVLYRILENKYMDVT